MLCLPTTVTASESSTSTVTRVVCASERDLWRDANKALVAAQVLEDRLQRSEKREQKYLARNFELMARLRSRPKVEVTPAWVPLAVAGLFVAGVALGALTVNL